MKNDLVRSSMLVLPGFMQGRITALTGRALAHQQYTNKRAPLEALKALMMLVSSSAISMWGFEQNHFWLLPFAMLFTISSMRNLQVVIYHHCSHDAIFKSGRMNMLLGEMIAICLVIKNFFDYKEDHLAHHSPKHLLTLKDETATDLQDLNLKPGMPYKKLVVNFWVGLLSPFNHLRWNANRLAQCFFSNHILHNIIAIAFWAVLSWWLYQQALLPAFAIAYLLPLFVFYNMSRVVRLVVEHCWPGEQVLQSRDLEFVSLSTKACFCGEMAPEKHHNGLINFLNLSWYSIKLFVFHGLLRLLILPGDTPNHDLHHRRPLADWANAEAAREKDFQEGCNGFPHNYQHIWGIPTAIRHNLRTLSQVKNCDWI